MEFTESIPAFGGKAVLSPNGRYLARLAPSTDFILLLQDTSTLSVLLSTSVPLLMDNEAAAGLPKSRHFPPPKPRRIMPQDISLIWAPDSRKIMLVDRVVNRIFIYDHKAGSSGEESGLIMQETLPCSRFLWAPDSAHFVSILDHRIGMRVWSLESRYPIKSISNIKSSEGGLDFSQDGNMMAVLHRKDGHDFIVLYNCRTWEAVQVLHPPEASMLEEVKFATGPFSRNHIAERPLLYAWELPCLSSRLFVFESDGSCKVVDVFCGFEAGGVHESFGFVGVEMSRSSDMAALIGNDGSIVLWNVLLQKPVTKIAVTADLTKLPRLIAFRERLVFGEESRFVKYESGYDLMLNELQSKTASQSLAPTINAKFSHDSCYLAIQSSLFPNHLWIYFLPDLSFIAVLCQLPTIVQNTGSSIKSFDWHPQQALLGMVTGSDYVYFWQPEGCHCIPQPYSDPEERCSRSFEWSHCENNLMLLSGVSACCLAVPDFISQRTS